MTRTRRTSVRTTTGPVRPVRTARRRGLAALSTAAVGVVALSSCAVSSPDLSTRTAAQVGSTSISLSEVDDAASAVCATLDTAAEQPVPSGQTAPQPYPGAEVRTSVLEGLVLRALGDKLREDLDVSPSADYGSQVAQARQFYADAPGPVEEVVPAVTGAAYYTDLVVQVGRISLGLDEVTNENAQQAFTAGLGIVSRRIGDTRISTNPVFPRLSLTDEPVQGTSLVYFDRDAAAQEVSVAVDGDAEAGAASASGISPERLAQLPDGQVCG